MKLLLINSVCGIGSTGKICVDIAEKYENDGYEVKIAYGRDGFVPENYKRFAVRIGTDFDVKAHAIRTRLMDDHGFGSVKATKQFLQWADEFDPNEVWLHNLHGYYINIELLFQWIKSRPTMKVKWTLHDCWSFTGHCTHFAAVRCDKWKIGCSKCLQNKEYPASLFRDRSKANYLKKKELFCGVEDMTIITPSNWLANLVKRSFLKDYPVEVRYNTVDFSVFKPTPSNFRKKFNLDKKIIVLGVANVWSSRKGLGHFLQLAQLLDDKYVIVLVGLTQQQIDNLPSGILGISRTHNLHELAQIYTAADVYVNPSLEETFGMTTVEAIACGTPAIVFRNTACEEIVNRYGGIAVEANTQAILEDIYQLEARGFDENE